MGVSFYDCHFDRSEAKWRNLLQFNVASGFGTARDVSTSLDMTWNREPRGAALPFDDRARPGQPAAEDDHQDVIASLDPAGAIRFIERDGDRGGRSVAVTIEIHEKSFERNLQPIGDRFDDAQRWPGAE